jgi:hypothetical protein
MPRRYLPKGTVARVAIQCKCPDSGETGSFIFTGESYKISGSRVSPVFPSLLDLYEWNKTNGWISGPPSTNTYIKKNYD